MQNITGLGYLLRYFMDLIVCHSSGRVGDLTMKLVEALLEYQQTEGEAFSTCQEQAFNVVIYFISIRVYVYVGIYI